ncbi:MAG: site-specific integrase [Pseudonocardiaceae bacterium]
MDEDWGTLVWLVMTTGLRRGEVCILRWARVELDAGEIEIRSSYRLRNGVGTEKDTKTHQMRRIALDTETVGLLRELKDRWRKRLDDLGLELADDMYVFTDYRQTVPTAPYSPHGVSSRYRDMATRLGINTHIHALRHYSATELLSAGIDLRTVAGRLSHGGGGATTLRVYAAWVAASDRKAAEILGSRMPQRRNRLSPADGQTGRTALSQTVTTRSCQWRLAKGIPGRLILRRYAGRYCNRVDYTTFSNVLLDKMVELGEVPSGMKIILDKILEA